MTIAHHQAPSVFATGCAQRAAGLDQVNREVRTWLQRRPITATAVVHQSDRKKVYIWEVKDQCAVIFMDKESARHKGHSAFLDWLVEEGALKSVVKKYKKLVQPTGQKRRKRNGNHCTL